jgi:hypothetical protein
MTAAPRPVSRSAPAAASASPRSVAATKAVTITVSGFKASDSFDLTGFAFKATEKPTFKENAAKTQGVLTITDGTLKATVALFGQYVAAGFHLAKDSGTGTVITYTTTPAHVAELAIPRG